MLRDITFGKYYSNQSLIHSLDGRVKLFALIVFVVSVFTIADPVLLIAPSVLIVLIIALSKIPVAHVLKSVWNVKFYIILCAVLYLISDLSKAGLIKSAVLCAKLILAVLFATMFTLTTTISHISDSFEWYLSPLKVFKIPVRDVAVMLSIALRFIPVLSEEASLIIQAQKARGAKFGRGAVLPLLIPIFESAVRRASDLSDALKARAYGISEKRTRLNPLGFKLNDLFVFLILLAYLFVVVWGNLYVN